MLTYPRVPVRLEPRSFLRNGHGFRLHVGRLELFKVHREELFHHCALSIWMRLQDTYAIGQTPVLAYQLR